MLVGLVVGFIFLNRQNYYYIKPPPIAGQDAQVFTPDANYYTLKDSWVDLTEDSVGDGGTCYVNSTCQSGICRYNPDLNQNLCFDNVADATKKGYTDTSPYESDNVQNYGSKILST